MTAHQIRQASALVLAAALALASAATAAPTQSHSRDYSSMACNDPKITAEMQDATDHTGSLSAAAYSRLWQQGQCSPIVPSVSFTVRRLFEFKVAAGVQKEAEAAMTLSDGSTNVFYIMQNRVVAGPARR
jgi:hypothetical protein